MESLHSREVRVLRRKAMDFLSEAHEALRRNHYDLSCFFSEQAVQLYLKSVLLELLGDYPRTHHTRTLLNEIIGGRSSDEVRKFMSENRARLSNLEDAYIIARYSTKPYSQEDAGDMVKLAEEIIEIVKRIMGVQ